MTTEALSPRKGLEERRRLAEELHDAGGRVEWLRWGGRIHRRLY